MLENEREVIDFAQSRVMQRDLVEMSDAVFAELLHEVLHINSRDTPTKLHAYIADAIRREIDLGLYSTFPNPNVIGIIVGFGTPAISFELARLQWPRLTNDYKTYLLLTGGADTQNYIAENYMDELSGDMLLLLFASEYPGVRINTFEHAFRSDVKDELVDRGVVDIENGDFSIFDALTREQLAILRDVGIKPNRPLADYGPLVNVLSKMSVMSEGIAHGVR